MTFTEREQVVPFYRQPTLAGNELLRGFERYRFHDENSILAAAEHRWYISPTWHGAIFFEAGKVAPKVSLLNIKSLQYPGGLGLRFTFNDTVIMRIDQAIGIEGYRFMWTFSNMW